jgi:hypothetical protein
VNARRLAWLLSAVIVAAFVAWIANNTYWADTKVPMPLKGEALTNPFYAAQRLTEALGARAAHDRVLALPAPSAVIVLSAWNWNLSDRRREALESWVESGGRLVVDWTLLLGNDEVFEKWSGITWDLDLERLKKEEEEEEKEDERCRKLAEDGKATTYELCSSEGASYLTTRARPLWALRDEVGIQAVRVRVGRGTVTAINDAALFQYRTLFDGDHALLFVAATGLHRGDEVHFLSEANHPSLVALTWQHGGPAVVLGLALVGLLLWRDGVRFGPLAADPPSARRSLAEQIRGSGQFTLRHGGGESLHDACVRALDEAARNRIPGYMSLSTPERAAAVATLTGLDRDALAAAVFNPGTGRTSELRNAIALLEAARRRVLAEHTRSTYGTH